MNVVEDFEDGSLGQGEAVIQHPLDLADPDHDPGQFRREGVDLDAQHILGSDQGEGPR